MAGFVRTPPAPAVAVDLAAERAASRERLDRQRAGERAAAAGTERRLIPGLDANPLPLRAGQGLPAPRRTDVDLSGKRHRPRGRR